MWFAMGFMAGPKPVAKQLSAAELKGKYRELAALINVLESAGEELTFWDTESRHEITGLTARVWKFSKYNGSWTSE